MLGKAKELSRGLGINFIQQDLTKKLPFDDGEFDVVVCSLVIEHVRELVPVLKEMKRICSQNGYILVSDLHPAMRLSKRPLKPNLRTQKAERISDREDTRIRCQNMS